MATNQNINFTITAKDAFTAPMRGVQNTMDRFRKDAATGFGMAAGLSIANMMGQALGFIKDQALDAVRASRDLLEQRTKSDAVFKSSSTIIKKFAEDAARSFGLSERAALEATGTMGNLLTAIGNTPSEAATMSLALTKLAADVSSFNNVASSEVLRAFNAALVGEAEPARRLGVNISMARVEALGFAQGLSTAKNQLTDSQKVMLRYQIIMQDTKNAQGDFARTSMNMANSQRILDASLENYQAQMGEFLLGPGTKMIQWATDFIDLLDGMNSASRAVRDEAVANLGAAGEALAGLPLPTGPSSRGTGIESSPFFWFIKNFSGSTQGGGQIAFIEKNKAVLDALQMSMEDFLAIRVELTNLYGPERDLEAFQKALNASAASIELNASILFDGATRTKSSAQRWAESNEQLRYTGMTNVEAFEEYNRRLQTNLEAYQFVYDVFGPEALRQHGIDPTKPLMGEVIRLTNAEMDAFIARAPEVIELGAAIVTGAGDPMMYQRMAQLARRRQMLTATLITGAGRSMNPFTGAGRQAEEAATEWVASFKSTMQNSMGEIRDLADDIEWSLTHPRKGEKLITRLKSQLRETRGMTRRANKITNDEQRRQTLADIDKLRSQIRTKLTELGAMDATVKINTTVNGGTAALSTIVYGGGRKGQEDPRAAGGSVRAGQTYLVGERGPEMLVMGSQNGHIIPNHSLGGGGNIVVNVDGERLFQIMNRRMGRAMAMGV